MKSQVLHTAWCNITVEATREIWTWSLLGVKGLTLANALRESVTQRGRSCNDSGKPITHRAGDVLESCRKRVDQFRRQVGNEADGVNEERGQAGRKFARVRGHVQCGEQLVFRLDPGLPGQGLYQGGLTWWQSINKPIIIIIIINIIVILLLLSLLFVSLQVNMTLEHPIVARPNTSSLCCCQSPFICLSEILYNYWEKALWLLLGFLATT